MSGLGSTIDPHPYDMPPAERAAYANGYGQGKREAQEGDRESAHGECERLRAELAIATKYGLIQWRKKVLAQIDADRSRAELARLREAATAGLMWWDGLPLSLRQDLEGSGAVPGWVAKARAALMDTPRQPSSGPD